MSAAPQTPTPAGKTRPLPPPSLDIRGLTPPPPPPRPPARWPWWLMLVVMLLAGVLYVKYVMAATYTVNTTADTGGSTCSGTCSLRQAINAANGAGAGPHTINFNISGCGSGCTITLGSDLPDLTRPINIDGSSQAGWSSVPLVRINGGTTNKCFNLKGGSSGSTIRSLVLSSCKDNGVFINGSSNNTIAGNYIGTSSTGNVANGSTLSGIDIKSGTGNTVGGTSSADRNVISGNGLHGIAISTDGNLVVGNYIGVGANSSTALGNGDYGIFLLSGASNNNIGGVNAADANIIANSARDGITLASGNSSGNSFLRNSIYANGERGIDFNEDGVTPNDLGDPDSGANGLQNFPVLSSAVTNAYSSITVAGSLNSNPNITFRIEFFSNATPDETGNGEGETYLGFTTVTTNGSGNATIPATVFSGVNVPAGRAISSTATIDLGGGVYGSTSEFSGNVTATLVPAGFTVSAISGNTTESGGTATFTVVLQRAPSASVTVPMSVSNVLEGSLSAASLVFTSANWFTPQTVTVTGLPDNLVDGNQTYTVVLGNATSADGAYNGLSPANVTVTNVDVDTRNTIFVTTLSDTSDGTTTSLYALLGNQGADLQISLREAITAANNTVAGPGGPNRIHFNIVGGGVRTIAVGASGLPSITRALIIDGSTQPLYAGTPLIELNGGNLGASITGLTLSTGSSGSTLRGLTINRFTSSAIAIINSSANNLVAGNYLGTDSTGLISRSNARWGVELTSAGANNLIGGSTAADRNLIAANTLGGISITSTSSVSVWGNYIGIGANGSTALGNSGSGGVLVATSSNTSIGGTGAGQGNLIANNTAGVQVTGAASGNNAILGNAIYDNGNLGIDLAGDGVTANDNLDPDSGPNGLQNYPVLTSASSNGTTQLTVVGSLNSLANNYFRIEFFASTAQHSSGYGQGQRYLGSLNLLTNASGNASINTTLSGVVVAAGEFISATATKSVVGYGSFTDTSEFARSITAVSTAQATLTVDTTADTVDGDTTSISTLLASKGTDGFISLREAITAANNTAVGSSGSHRINFNISGAGVRSINVGATGLPAISKPVIIDGSTQPLYASSPLIELNGGNLGSGIKGLQLAAGSTGSSLIALTINRFTGSGIDIVSSSSHTILGNWIGLNNAGTAAQANGGNGIHASASSGLLIGGSTASTRNVVAGNTLQGVFFTNTSSSTIAGNHIGTNAAGTADINGTGSNTAQSGVYLTSGSSGNTVGGTTAAARNVISGNNHYGVEILGTTSQNNAVQGNYIGSTVSGLAALGNTNGGVSLWGAGSGNFVGGGVSGAGNVIAANNTGVLVGNATNSATVQGNFIGVGADGSTALGNSGPGVLVQDSSTSARIGSDNNGSNDANEGNVIANNSIGISVVGNTNGVALSRNNVYANTALGIDLAANGVSINDGAKTAGQPNLLMDHPVFTVAQARGNQLRVVGYVGSAAGQAIFANARVEIFTSDNDASGFGEGRTYLGAVTADASGNFSNTITMTQSTLRFGSTLTGTATDASGNSSEFGATFSGLLIDLVVNDNGDAVDASAGDGFCATAGGVCTLRAAIAELNAQPTPSSAASIVFALPGCSAAGQAACTITPATALPTLTRAIFIDGQSQSGWVQDPIVELRGSSAPATANGIDITAANSTVRGLVIGGFGQAGIQIGASNTTVQGNFIGLQAGGSAARGNGSLVTAYGGVLVNSGSGTLIGGTTAAQRNVISGNLGPGVWLAGGTATLTGNYVGLNAAGTAAVGNGRWGLVLFAGSGHRVGGSAAGERNVVSGNTGTDTGGIYVAANSSVVQGNFIGLNAAGLAAVPNGTATGSLSSGIDLRSGTGHLVGGTAAGEGNTIASNNGFGVRITAQTSQVLGNSIYSNLWLGIDRNADGVSANDGVFNGGQPNNGIDHPVFTGAGISGAGNSITITGFVGTGSGQAVFAGARVEIFKALADASGYGQGQIYLGFMTADANGRFSGTLGISVGAVVVGDRLTATATDAAGNSSEFGPNWTTTTLAALSPAGFNVFETSTAAGAISGFITSKTAGAAATLAVLALDSAGTAPHAGFTGTVTLRWLDARNDSGGFTGSCRSSWVDIGAAGSVSFSNNNRINTSFTPPALSTKVMRLQITYVGASTVVACSNDNFAGLPAQLAWLGASDADSATAGTTRTLNNTVASGGVVHRAGRSFTLRAQALDALGNLMTAYDGSPTLSLVSCLLPASCSPGSLGGSSATAAAGVYRNDLLTYSEVGAVSLQLSDTSYGNVDVGDTALPARTFGSSTLAVGRFVPDSYAASISTSGVLATANAACMAVGSGATFFGQGFGWATVPQVTITARNAAGGTTALWTGSLMKLAPGAGLVPALAAAGAGSASLGSSYGAFTVQDLGAGQARLLANALDRWVLDLPAATYQVSTTPSWQWQLAVTDSSEAGTSGNPQPSVTATQAGLAFNSGGVFHSGRLSLATAFGDARSGVRMLAQLQRYTSAGWVTLTEDRGCVSLPRAALEVSAPTGVFVSSGLCAAPLAATAVTSGGRAWLSLPATPGGATGRLSLRLAGTTASGSACSPTGTVQAVTSLGLPWLTGGSSGAGPLATATWGRAQRDLVLRREIW